MKAESRRFLLLSQVAFASLSALPWILITFYALWLSPPLALLLLGYGLAGLFVFIRWIHFARLDRTSTTSNIASVCLWAVPFAVSIGGIILIFFEQFDGRADIFNDCEYRPIDYIGLPLVSALWFGHPLLCAAFLTKDDWCTNSKANQIV